MTPDPPTSDGARPGLPMTIGSSGDAVRDLHRRLAVAGFATPGADPGVYGPSTDASVRAFQHARGLRIDGICGPQTWDALVDAGYQLGDRLLYLRVPMFRGDDVAALQRRLGALGFDAGKVDGRFGPDTARALLDFQRNAGLQADGIVGADDCQILERLGRGGRAARGPVAEVRELENLRCAPRTLAGRVVAIGEHGGLDALIQAVARGLGRAGAEPVVVQHPDGGEHAARANTIGAAAYIGLATALSAHPTSTVAYYRFGTYISYAGKRLAELIGSETARALGAPDADVSGMALPVLRETRMPAVVVEAGPPSALVEHAAALADGIVAGLVTWAAERPVVGA